MKSLHVYLINEAEYVAAESEEQAKEYALNPDSEYFDAHDEIDLEIKQADSHGFCDDGYSDRTPDRTMLEQAEFKVSQGEVTPFHVGIHFNLM